MFGGSDESLVFTPIKTSYPQSFKPTLVSTTAITMKASVVKATYISSSKQDKEFLDYIKEEMIGAECVPQCGGCRCGQCVTGSIQMTLKEERDLEHFESLMYLEEKGTVNNPGPYRVMRQLWVVEKRKLG